MEKLQKTNKYDDIINMPHPRSKTRPHMSYHDRAAQFAPFAALTGLDEEMDDAAKVSEEQFINDVERIEPEDV